MKKNPVAHVSKEIADAFGMRGIPNTVVEPVHTPTPWFNWGTYHQGRRPTICSKAPGSGYSVGSEIASVNTDADAAFIVKAVNSHEELLGELKSLVAWIEEFPERAESMERQLNNAKVAIAKAEGK